MWQTFWQLYNSGTNFKIALIIIDFLNDFSSLEKTVEKLIRTVFV